MLDREILERRLDHDVAVSEIGELGRQRQAGERSVARILRELALLDLAGQEVRDLVARRLRARKVDLTTDRVEAGFDRELCDARAHRPQADDAHLHRRSTTPAIAMPKPTHMDAMP